MCVFLPHLLLVPGYSGHCDPMLEPVKWDSGHFTHSAGQTEDWAEIQICSLNNEGHGHIDSERKATQLEQRLTNTN